MRAVVQRVARASVHVDEREVGSIGRGLLVLLGVGHEDGSEAAAWMADKLVDLRIFEDQDGKMNRSLLDVEGEVLLVSQFTLFGDARKGRRPSFIRAARGPEAERSYLEVARRVAERGVPCSTGEFGAIMQVSLVNDGPVTILLDSERSF